MKKILSLLLCLTMLSGLFTLPAFAADEETAVNVELTELLFIGSDGSAIGEIPDTNVKARATVTADGAETVSLYLAAYNADGSLASVDVSTESFTGDSTKIIETPLGVDAKGADRVSAFVWKSGQSPVIERVDLGSQAILLGADITVPDFKYNATTYGDYTFDAVVNNESKKVTFYIPYTTYSNEINAYGVMNYPGVTPNVDAVTYSLDTVGTASLAENTAIDADTVNSITVTSPDGTAAETYSVEHKFVAVERRLTDEAAVTIDGTKITYNTVDVLNGNVQLNASGGYIQIPSGAVTKASDSNSLNLKFDSTTAAQNITFRASAITGENNLDFYGSSEPYKNDHVKISFKFIVNDFAPVSSTDGRFAYINTINKEGLILEATGDDTFVINHRHAADGSANLDARYAYCPELKTGTWYTYTMVLDKGAQYDKGYVVNAYIDGKYIGSSADAKEAEGIPGAAFDRSGAYDLHISTFAATTLDMNIADVEAVSVMGDEKYEDKTTVHILGDSIVRFYSTSTTETSQEGWGYALSRAFDMSKVRVLNHSVGGYNSNIYLYGANRDALKQEPIWQSIERYIKSGDYVLIAIGRNESNATDGTKTTANFVANLQIMADKVVAAGAIPVFVNAIPAVSITDDVYSVDNGINFTGSIKAAYDMRNFAAQNGYALLDLNAESYHTLMDMTSDELKTIFLSDKVHITETGANLIAELMVKLIAENTDCNLKDYFAESYDTNHAYVKSATAVIDGTTYTADVNTDSNTITFEQVLVPLKEGGVNGEYAVASDASVSIVANGTVSGIGETVDLTTPQTITVTQGTDVQTYTVQFDKAQYVRTYNANGNKNDNGGASTVALRKYILASDSSTGNLGFGGWFGENAASPDGTSQAGYGTLRADNGVVKFNKTTGGKALNLGSFAGDISAQGTNDKVSARFDIKVNSLSSADTNSASGTLYINSGHLDQILITRIGAPEGKYFIGYRPNADDGKIFTYTAKPLSFGETYTIKYVFNKDASAPAGYRMAIYIDGEFITETDFSYRVDTNSEYSVPAGDLTSWPGTATSFGNFSREAQILIRSFSQCLADVEFDNFVITCIPTT